MEQRENKVREAGVRGFGHEWRWIVEMRNILDEGCSRGSCQAGEKKKLQRVMGMEGRGGGEWGGEDGS